MRDMTKDVWTRFFNWVMGNVPRISHEVVPPEPPPELPFAWKPPKKPRFREMTMRERRDIWLEHNALRILSALYNGMSVLICLMLVALLLAAVAWMPEMRGPVISEGEHGVLDALGIWSVLFAASLGGAACLHRDFDRRHRGLFESLRNICARFFDHLRQHNDISELSESSSLSFVRTFLASAVLMSGLSLIVGGYAGPDWGIAAGAALSVALLAGSSRDSAEAANILMPVGGLSIILCACAFLFFDKLSYIFVPICIGLITAGALCAFCAFGEEA